MLRQLTTGMFVCGLLFGMSHAAESPPRPELETFVVSGEQPGPGLWKVTKDDHVMWVLAAYGPLPKGMTWRAQQIDARIAESQEVLYPPNIGVSAGIGLMRGLTLIPAMLKAQKIPEDKTLKDVLSPEIYAKWLVLRERYIGKDDDVERLRPSIGLQSLRRAAFRKSGLQGGPNVYEVVGKARKKYKIPQVQIPAVIRTLKVEDPRGIIKSAQKLQLPDVECFAEGLDKVEPDVERAKRLAAAWSHGDIATMRSLHRNLKIRDLVEESCTYALTVALNEGESANSTHAKKMFEDAMWHAEQAGVQAQLDWVAAAQKALAKNQSTFAVLGVADVFRPDGHLEKLRALGYTVEEPQ
jgi:hypothetical protein